MAGYRKSLSLFEKYRRNYSVRRGRLGYGERFSGFDRRFNHSVVKIKYRAIRSKSFRFYGRYCKFKRAAKLRKLMREVTSW